MQSMPCMHREYVVNYTQYPELRPLLCGLVILKLALSRHSIKIVQQKVMMRETFSRTFSFFLIVYYYQAGKKLQIFR